MTDALVTAAAGVVKKMKKKEAQDLDGLLQVTVLGAYWLQLRDFTRARRLCISVKFPLVIVPLYRACKRS